MEKENELKNGSLGGVFCGEDSFVQLSIFAREKKTPNGSLSRDMSTVPSVDEENARFFRMRDHTRFCDGRETEMSRNDEGEGGIIHWFEQVCREASAIQAQTLGQIIRRNVGAEYLKRWMGHLPQLHEMEDQELESLFTSLVPVSSHADYDPYIQRVAEGDPSPILIQEPVTTLSLRSESIPLCLSYAHKSEKPNFP